VFSAGKYFQREAGVMKNYQAEFIFFHLFFHEILPPAEKRK